MFTAEDAYEKIRAGAALVDIYTGFVYGRPATPRRIARGLVRLLEHDVSRRLSDAMGRTAADAPYACPSRAGRATTGAGE